MWEIELMSGRGHKFIRFSDFNKFTWCISVWVLKRTKIYFTNADIEKLGKDNITLTSKKKQMKLFDWIKVQKFDSFLVKLPIMRISSSLQVWKYINPYKNTKVMLIVCQSLISKYRLKVPWLIFTHPSKYQLLKKNSNPCNIYPWKKIDF